MYACLQVAAEARPSRSKRPRPLPTTSSVVDPLPGTVFAYGDAYIVRLYGFHESTGKAVFALLSADCEYECLLPTALSSRFLTSPPLPLHSELAAAVSQLLRHPPIFAYARAPRRAEHAVPHPRLSSSRVHPQFAQLYHVTGPLTSPLPPPRTFESIMLSPPGPSATSPQVALLHQWGVLSHPLRAVPTSYVIMSYADTLVRRYIVRHQPASSIHNVLLPPSVTASLIHGQSGQMVCLSASHSGRPIRLSDLTYLSIDVVAELFFIPSVHPVVTHLHTLSHHIAYSLICRGVSCLASSSLIRPLLSQPRIARRLRSGQSLRVVSVFSGIELFLVAFYLLGVPIQVLEVSDVDPVAQAALTELYPSAQLCADASKTLLTHHGCDFLVGGAFVSSSDVLAVGETPFFVSSPHSPFVSLPMCIGFQLDAVSLPP